MEYTLVSLVTGLLLILVVTFTQQQEELGTKHVTLSFLTEDGSKFNTPCNSIMRQTKVMSFNITKVKAADACSCHVVMGKEDQFLNIQVLNGSMFELEERLAVYSGTGDEFDLGISSQDDIYIQVQDKEEMDLYECYSDSLINIVAIPGPTVSIECQQVPQSLVRPLYANNSTNGTVAAGADPEPVDITNILIGIAIGFVVLIIVATLLVFLILHIKRQDRKNGFGRPSALITKPGTDYVQVPEGSDTDQIQRRPPPASSIVQQQDSRLGESPLAKRKDPSPRSDPDIEIESSFGGVGRKTGGMKPQHADLDIHDDDPYRAKKPTTTNVRDNVSAEPPKH